jgi:hypothetical protein
MLENGLKTSVSHGSPKNTGGLAEGTPERASPTDFDWPQESQVVRERGKAFKVRPLTPYSLGQGREDTLKERLNNGEKGYFSFSLNEEGTPGGKVLGEGCRVGTTTAGEDVRIAQEIL